MGEAKRRPIGGRRETIEAKIKAGPDHRVRMEAGLSYMWKK